MISRGHLPFTIVALTTVFTCLNTYGQGGVVLEKPYGWSPQTEVVSVKEFSRQAVRGPWETGYRDYFIGTDGKRFGVERSKIAKVIFYPDIRAYTEIQDESQVSPILSDIDELKKLEARYPSAKRHLDRQLGKLENEVSLFRGGARKLGGVWHSAAEIAREKQEAADREAKLEAARKAEEERQAAIRKAEEERLAAVRAAEERAAEERRAAAEAALAKQTAEFKKEAMNVLTNTTLPRSDFQELRTLDDVKELTAKEREKISALAEKVRSLREEESNKRLLEECHVEMAGVLALDARAKIAEEIHANNASGALATVNSFLHDNPSPPSDAQSDLWKSLTSIRVLCSRLEREAKPHREKAQSLSSSGKAGDAIQEYQTAYGIFPDPKVADTIKQLRENSLGL